MMKNVFLPILLVLFFMSFQKPAGAMLAGRDQAVITAKSSDIILESPSKVIINSEKGETVFSMAPDDSKKIKEDISKCTGTLQIIIDRARNEIKGVRCEPIEKSRYK